MAGRRLTEEEGRAVVAWATAPGNGGCTLVGAPPGPVRSRAPAGEGLLSDVVLLDTPAGSLAVKAPTDRPSGLAWLDSLAVMRHEAAFYLAVGSIEAPAALPRVVAVAPEAGVVVMEGRVPTRVLDQAAGLGGDEAERVV
ncbi:MAG TPA: hypothetical protein VGO78_22850, partial [Acidimicrobiales bacterium]|nr:hypothetical protein [Acidimicrobiales bacterium]